VFAILTISPTIITFVLMLGSALLGRPVLIEQVSWLLINTQLTFLVIGTVATLLAKKSEKTMPAWRAAANRWIGRIMAAAGLFYAIAFALVTYYAP
jgi:hypothetical protein